MSDHGKGGHDKGGTKHSEPKATEAKKDVTISLKTTKPKAEAGKEKRKVVVPEQAVPVTGEGMYSNDEFTEFLVGQVGDEAGAEEHQARDEKLYKIFVARKEAAKVLAEVAKEALHDELSKTSATEKKDFSKSLEAGLDARLATLATIAEKKNFIEDIVNEAKMHTMLEDQVRTLEDKVAEELGDTTMDELQKKKMLLENGLSPDFTRKEIATESFLRSQPQYTSKQLEERRKHPENYQDEYKELEEGAAAVDAVEPKPSVAVESSWFKRQLNKLTEKGRAKNLANDQKKRAQEVIKKELGIEAENIQANLAKVNEAIKLASELDTARKMLGTIRGNLKNLATAGGEVQRAIKADRQMRLEALHPKKKKADVVNDEGGESPDESVVASNATPDVDNSPKPPDVKKKPETPTNALASALEAKKPEGTGLTEEALKLINDKTKVPPKITKDFRRIAKENGVKITDTDNPEDVINKLRAKVKKATGAAAAPATPDKKAKPGKFGAADLLAQALGIKTENQAKPAEAAPAQPAEKKPEETTVSEAEVADTEEETEEQKLQKEIAKLSPVERLAQWEELVQTEGTYDSDSYRELEAQAIKDVKEKLDKLFTAKSKDSTIDAAYKALVDVSGNTEYGLNFVLEQMAEKKKHDAKIVGTVKIKFNQVEAKLKTLLAKLRKPAGHA